MNDDRLLRDRAEKAESALEEERHFCARCYDQHRHTLQTLHAKLTSLTREVADFIRGREEAQAELAVVTRERDEARVIAEAAQSHADFMQHQRDEARAEVAALREALKMAKPLGPDIDWSAPTVSMARFVQEMRAWTRDIDEERMRADRAERDLAEARKLLALWHRMEYMTPPEGVREGVVRDTDALLRRDEARRPSDECPSHPCPDCDREPEER